MKAKPPLNVLLVITDQQRATDTGFMGNPILKTPHLDALAARAMVFDNAWVANPVCMPNRSSLMTGGCPQRMASFSMIAHWSQASIPSFGVSEKQATKRR